jgi:uncharacterized protein (TIGR02646 family)
VKRVRKGRKPRALSKFERENAATPQLLVYGEFRGPPKRAVEDQMLREQGRLCAYTMRRIGEVDAAGRADFHIEHIQSQKRHPALQLKYSNLVLCAPGDKHGHCEWGAKRKDETEVGDLNFVSPLRADCESRLSYRWDGSVEAANGRDAAAIFTIELLNLNHRELVALRLAALNSFGLGENTTRSASPTPAKLLSAKAAESLSKRVCDRNANGDFAAFCVTVQQLAGRFARKAHDRAARVRGKH